VSAPVDRDASASGVRASPSRWFRIFWRLGLQLGKSALALLHLLGRTIERWWCQALVVLYPVCGGLAILLATIALAIRETAS